MAGQSHKGLSALLHPGSPPCSTNSRDYDTSRRFPRTTSSCRLSKTGFGRTRCRSVAASRGGAQPVSVPLDAGGVGNRVGPLWSGVVALPFWVVANSSRRLAPARSRPLDRPLLLG